MWYRNKVIDDAKKDVQLGLFLLCLRVGQFKWFNMAVTLAVLLKLVLTNLAARPRPFQFLNISNLPHSCSIL